jgi:hypothetical protein
MYKFEEIIGAELEAITQSEAAYVDADESGEVLNIKGISLAFDRGWFVVENPHTVFGVANLNEIVGTKVVDAYSSEDEIRLQFSNGSVISVSLKDKDFVGPEAASYSPKRGEIIVFN